MSCSEACETLPIPDAHESCLSSVVYIFCHLCSCSGQIIIGGGLVKHHTCNANLMRNGADYSVYINTGHDFDGSDSGASPDEAVSWGKIRITAKPVKVTVEATIAFPLIVSQTFAKEVDEWKRSTERCVCWAEDMDGALQS